MRKTLTFDTNKPHIHLEFQITDLKGVLRNVSGILDSGAPKTEFSDQFLTHTGFLAKKNKNISLKAGLQTQKYGKIVLPSVNIGGHQIDTFEVFVSHFEESWGIDALIGLDFFRQYRVTVDYAEGILITETYKPLSPP